MKLNKAILISLFSLGSSSVATWTNASTLTTDQIYNIGVKAYIYAYPLVVLDTTRKIMTNVVAPDTKMKRAPINQFVNINEFPRKTIIKANYDALYSSAWVNLSKRPVILSVPAIQDRYYVLELIDNWGHVFASIGSRTTGTDAKNFAIVGPDGNTQLPSNVTEIKAPTNFIWIVGYTQTHSINDFESVKKIQADYKLTPLNAWGITVKAPGTVFTNPLIDMQTSPTRQVAQMDAKRFFTAFANALKQNPPLSRDKTLVAELDAIGISPKENFDKKKLTPEQMQVLNNAVKDAQKKISNYTKKLIIIKNNWIQSANIPTGQNYIYHAAAVKYDQKEYFTKDIISLTTAVDADSQPLNGKNIYILHFDKKDLPPAEGFWSITLYNKNGLLYKNDIDRHTITNHDQLIYNPDGSLDIYLQYNALKTSNASNWLPTPRGYFNITLRLYSPKQSALNGEWRPPEIKGQNKNWLW